MHFFAMDDVTFYKPVEIGDILTLDACVTYTSPRTDATHQNFIQVCDFYCRNCFSILIFYPSGRSNCLCDISKSGRETYDQHIQFHIFAYRQ